MVKIDELITCHIRIFSKSIRESIAKGATYHGTGYIQEKGAFYWQFYPTLSSLNFSYTCNGTEYKYDVKVEVRSSNLGIMGNYYYFLCPETGRRCRRLYLYEGRFVSRSAIPKIVYKSQYDGKYARRLFYVMLCGMDAVKKYGKEYYRGKITPYGRRLERMLSKSRRAQKEEYLRGSSLSVW